MLKEAIEKIREMAQNEDRIQTVIIDRKVYARNASGDLVYIADEETRTLIPEIITASSLEGFTEWVKEEIRNDETKRLFVEVSDYSTVTCREEKGWTREGIAFPLYRVCVNNNTFRDGFRGIEETMIELRSKYQYTDDIDYLLRLLGSITLEDKVKSDDNGLTQQVTVRKGIALTANETIKPIVKLKPYRTFYEVEQPESEFLVRVDIDGHIGFFEADGGMWKMTARRIIKDYLVDAFAKEIADRNIIVTL